MKKAEIELHASEYRARAAHATSALNRGDYRRALETAMSAWAFLDGMILFERSVPGHVPGPVVALEIVADTAPLLMDRRALTRLTDFLQENKRAAKAAGSSMTSKLARAMSMIWDCRRLWNHLEDVPGESQSLLFQKLGGDRATWEAIVAAWSKIGVLQRVYDGNSFRLWQTTRMGEIMRAKCSLCGLVEHAPKAMLLEPMTCPTCNTVCDFVMLDPVDQKRE